MSLFTRCNRLSCYLSADDVTHVSNHVTREDVSTGPETNLFGRRLDHKNQTLNESFERALMFGVHVRSRSLIISDGDGGRLATDGMPNDARASRRCGVSSSSSCCCGDVASTQIRAATTYHPFTFKHPVISAVPE